MERTLSGRGAVIVAADRAQVWSALLDPEVLRVLTPGADAVERSGEDRYHATVSFGIGAMRGRYGIDLLLSDMTPLEALSLAGSSRGVLGRGDAVARVELVDVAGGTRVEWDYAGTVSGLVSLAGGPLLRASSRLFVDRFFANLARHLAASEH